jgi:hypothetical protein
VNRKHRRRIIIGATAATVAAAAGGAYAATQSSDTNPRQALLNDVAHRLHVTPAELTQAYRGALIDQLQAAVKAGRLTQAQAGAIEQRIRQGGPGLGLPRAPGPGAFHARLGHRGVLDAAARYLGLSDPQLLGQLSAGKTLAQVAQARHKSVDGLERALIAGERTRIERALSAGRISKDLAQQMESNIASRVGALVNRAWPRLMGPRDGVWRGRFVPGPAGGPGGAGAPGQAGGVSGGPSTPPAFPAGPNPAPNGSAPAT